MPRRKKSELYQLTDRIIKLYKEGKTLDQITEILQSEGYEISRSSIHRTIKDYKRVAAELRRSAEMAKALVEAIREDPTNTSAIEIAQSIIAQKLLEEAMMIETLNIRNPMALISAITKMAQAQVSVAKLRLEYERGYEAAKRRFLEELTRVLADEHPELLSKLVGIISGLKG